MVNTLAQEASFTSIFLIPPENAFCHLLQELVPIMSGCLQTTTGLSESSAAQTYKHLRLCDITAFGASAVAGNCPQPAAVPRARAEVGAERRPECVLRWQLDPQQHHGWPRILVASASLCAPDAGPSPRPFQPS